MSRVLLLIDDDEDDREVFREAIHTCAPDVDVVFAVDGLQALDLLSSGAVKPDFIFLDYNMPRMNGVQCLKALKRSNRFRKIPTIVYTTSADREHEKVIRLLGADEYMQKTTSFTDLCSELSRLLANPVA